MKMKKKKAQSEVVTTVLLILIGIIAVTIVAIFVTNFVNNQKDKSKCFDALNLIEIKNSPKYTCYDSTATPARMLVQIGINDPESLLEGFTIEVGGANTKTYKILNWTTLADIVMYSPNAQPNELKLEVPGSNEERTYNITSATKPDKINVYPILKGGRVCSSSSSLNSIDDC